MWQIWLITNTCGHSDLYDAIAGSVTHPYRCATALSLNAEAFMNNRTSQAVEPEKLTRKFYKKNSGALLGAGAYN